MSDKIIKLCTVLHTLNSPQNVGMIVRSHVAHAGELLVFTGHYLPWRFKKGSQAFSRKLEKQARFVHIPEPDEAIQFLRSEGYSIVAVEIAETAESIRDFKFSNDVALIFGNEAHGLPTEFLDKADSVVTIPQYAAVGSLNVAVSASIAMYELMKQSPIRQIQGDEFV
ncbi:MAG: tRNA G18 (ribose-2'-O)-methylase SpoU [Granulosicoccus sp.]|jgi:tRNA G18 (ribose-2'-O)-methylase SpoU